MLPATRRSEPNQESCAKRKPFRSANFFSGLLKEQEGGTATADVCRKHGVSSSTYYDCKAKYCGLEVPDAPALEGDTGPRRRIPLKKKESSVKTATHKNRKAGYHIGESREPLELEKEVAQMLAMGWEPAGGIQVVISNSVSLPTYYQSLWYAYAE